jgi:5-methylcytosine-specific restriction endonuclease McrA
MQSALSCVSCGHEKPTDGFRFRKDKQKHVSKCKECEKEYQRAWYWANPEKGRAKAAKSMKKLRADPEKRESILSKQRAYYHAKGKHTEKAYYERIKASDPWGWRVRNLRRNINPGITVEWLRALWQSQGGRCALSGREMDIRTAELDHIVPKSRNGSDGLENLRLVVPEANQAKGGMLDAEFLALCADVLRQQPELIGRAILQSMRAA